MSVIGIIRLAPGQVGYFDDLTRIHLTIASPEKPVVSGMNTTNLKRAVKSGRILLTSGSLDVAVKTQAPATTPVKEVKAQTQAPAETHEIKEESGVVTIDTDAALQKIQKEKEIVPTVEETTVEETTVEETTVEESVEETAAEEAAVEEVVVAETEVVEETPAEKTEAEVKETAAEEVVEEAKAEDTTKKAKVKTTTKRTSTKKK